MRKLSLRILLVSLLGVSASVSYAEHSKMPPVSKDAIITFSKEQLSDLNNQLQELGKVMRSDKLATLDNASKLYYSYAWQSTIADLYSLRALSQSDENNPTAVQWEKASIAKMYLDFTNLMISFSYLQDNNNLYSKKSVSDIQYRFSKVCKVIAKATHKDPCDAQVEVVNT